MLKAIIFDMDGVLVKSEGSIVKSFNMVLEKYGAKLNPENKKKFLGRSLRDQLEMMKEDNPQIPKNLSVEQFSKEAFNYQLEIMKEKLIPDLVILNLTKEAKAKNIKIAVATSSLKYRAETLLKLIGIFDQLDTLVTSEDVENHKPHPDIFLEASKRINVLPENCVVIEDAVNGIQGANNAGMKSVAMVTENHPKEDFKEANYIFSDFKNLKLGDLISLF
jgi:HAD superfamily hydrolase (TIGR01509 family)